MGINFELPTMLQVERAGRMMASLVSDNVEAGVDGSLSGAAALVAIRHIVNHGFNVSVQLIDQEVNAAPVFQAQCDILKAMGIPLQQAGKPSGGKSFPSVISGTDMTATTGDANFLVAPQFFEKDHKLRWDCYRAKGNPFLKKCKSEDALSATQAREVDQLSTKKYHIPSLCLMENAGIGATAVAASMLDRLTGEGPIIILVGPGNNGGDGLVVARGLVEKGLPVELLLLSDPEKLSADAKSNFDILQQVDSIPIQQAPDDPEVFHTQLSQARLLVDAIFGTGLSRTVEGKYADIITAANASGRPILALDLPSGLDADSGETHKVCIHASRTVTFAAPKPGLFYGSGPDMTGPTLVADIGCPRELLKPQA